LALSFAPQASGVEGAIGRDTVWPEAVEAAAD
jgi:hypothetical protein